MAIPALRAILTTRHKVAVSDSIIRLQQEVSFYAPLILDSRADLVLCDRRERMTRQAISTTASSPTFSSESSIRSIGNLASILLRFDFVSQTTAIDISSQSLRLAFTSGRDLTCFAAGRERFTIV